MNPDSSLDGLRKEACFGIIVFDNFHSLRQVINMKLLFNEVFKKEKKDWVGVGCNDDREKTNPFYPGYSKNFSSVSKGFLYLRSSF